MKKINFKFIYAFGAILLLILVSISSFFIYKYYSGSRKTESKSDNNLNTTSYTASYPSQDSDIITYKTFESKNIPFKINLPDYVIMTESESTELLNGYTPGEVHFVFEQNQDRNKTKEIIFAYGKPRIIGKGGYCSSGYTSETIENQIVSVCKNSQYISVEYFKHPTKEIEFGIYSNNLTTTEIEIFNKQLRESFEFVSDAPITYTPVVINMEDISGESRIPSTFNVTAKVEVTDTIGLGVAEITKPLSIKVDGKELLSDYSDAKYYMGYSLTLTNSSNKLTLISNFVPKQGFTEFNALDRSLVGVKGNLYRTNKDGKWIYFTIQENRFGDGKTYYDFSVRANGANYPSYNSIEYSGNESLLPIIDAFVMDLLKY